MKKKPDQVSTPPGLCPECLEPYTDGEKDGDTCAECLEYHAHQDDEYEDALRHQFDDMADADCDDSED